MSDSRSAAAAALLALVTAAFSESWRWYLNRIAGTPEEALALAVALALVGWVAWTSHRDPGPAVAPNLPLLSVTAALFAYAGGAFVGLPAIVLAAIAAVTTVALAYRLVAGTAPPLALYGLLALSMPVVPSLQFVLGYPMRVVSAAATVTLLQLQGFAVARSGTNLVWNSEPIEFDAPCSGVNMLWAALMLVLAVCVLWRASPRLTFAAILFTVPVTLAANVLRATSLFVVETGAMGAAPEWWHEGIGLAAFAGVAAVTVQLLLAMRRAMHREPCR